MQETIDAMRAQMKEMLDDPEMRKMIDEGAQREVDERRQLYPVERLQQAGFIQLPSQADVVRQAASYNFV